MSIKEETLTIRLSKELKTEFFEAFKDMELSAGQIIRRLMRDEIEKLNQFKAQKNKGRK